MKIVPFHKTQPQYCPYWLGCLTGTRELVAKCQRQCILKGKMPRIVKKILLLPGVFSYWIKSAGWRATLTWLAYRIRTGLGFQEPSSLTIQPRQTKFPVIARLGGSSDLSVFKQIFQFEEYACVLNISPPGLIVDLGANVGYSSAYFLSRFSAATVVAVEPDPGNFEICRKNLAPYGDRAQIVQGAAWSNRSRLVLSRGTFGDGSEWATQVRQGEGTDGQDVVEGWDMPSLLELSGRKQIDLLKVDIERSELELFGPGSLSWLPNVRNICIELHGDDCKEVFLEALKNFEYDLGYSGELTICRNLRRKSNN